MKQQIQHRSATLLIAFTLLLTALTALAVYFPLYVSLPVCIVLPLLVVLARGGIGAFEKIKILTLVTGRIIVLLAVLTLIPGNTLALIMMWLFRLNIAEATVKDLVSKNYFNVISGVILLVTTWFFTIHWSGVYYFTEPSVLILWALAYTVWNWNFVNNNFNKSISFYHVGVLAAPLIAALAAFNPGIWLIMRGTSLTMAGTLQIGAEQKVTDTFKSSWFERLTRNMRQTRAQALLTLLVSALVLAFMISS